MTNKVIKQAREDLCNIEKPNAERKQLQRFGQMDEWLTKYGVYHRRAEAVGDGVVWWREAVENAHRFLQTAMMLNSCFFAKRSCIWAAIAATIAFFATIAAWITVVLTLRGK